MTHLDREQASIACGAAAIALPGGPTAVPFRPCCALAIIQAAATCPMLDRAGSVAGAGPSGLAQRTAFLVGEPS